MRLHPVAFPSAHRLTSDKGLTIPDRFLFPAWLFHHRGATKPFFCTASLQLQQHCDVSESTAALCATAQIPPWTSQPNGLAQQTHLKALAPRGCRRCGRQKPGLAPQMGSRLPEHKQRCSWYPVVGPVSPAFGRGSPWPQNTLQSLP